MTELMTVAEFEQRYRISHSSFYREVAAGRIAVRKLGRASRISVADAENWLASLPVYNGGAANV